VKKSTPIIILLATVILLSVVWNYVYPPRNSEEGFGIILTEDDSKLVSDVDIQRYNSTSHELTLTDECANRMKKMREPLMGDFIIIIDGKEDLRGIFVPPVVSRSYPSTEVVIVYPSFMSDYKTMKIQMGYPWDQPTDHDPRQKSKMIQYFDITGRLTR
jgi:hypothetical protein